MSVKLMSFKWSFHVNVIQHSDEMRWPFSCQVGSSLFDHPWSPIVLFGSIIPPPQAPHDRSFQLECLPTMGETQMVWRNSTALTRPCNLAGSSVASNPANSNLRRISYEEPAVLPS
jgi:hypothetical protein